MTAKQRSNAVERGVRAAFNTTFSDSDVREIRRRLGAGESKRSLAREWRVAYTTIAKMARRDTFDYVSDDPAEVSVMPTTRAAEALEEQRQQQSENERRELEALIKGFDEKYLAGERE